MDSLEILLNKPENASMREYVIHNMFIGTETKNKENDVCLDGLYYDRQEIEYFVVKWEKLNYGMEYGSETVQHPYYDETYSDDNYEDDGDETYDRLKELGYWGDDDKSTGENK